MNTETANNSFDSEFTLWEYRFIIFQYLEEFIKVVG